LRTASPGLNRFFHDHEDCDCHTWNRATPATPAGSNGDSSPWTEPSP
jgi:hypothetical protein